MYPTKNDLPEAPRRRMIDLCNARLADAIDLQTQTKQAHWNVKGPQFIALHELEESDRVHDENTNDIFIEISRGVDKCRWMIEAHLHAEG